MLIHMLVEMLKKIEAKVCDNHFLISLNNGVIIVVISIQIVEKLFRRKVVIQDEVTNEALSELELEAIEDIIIMVPDSDFFEVR